VVACRSTCIKLVINILLIQRVVCVCVKCMEIDGDDRVLLSCL
jgi:hypothetical protein